MTLKAFLQQHKLHLYSALLKVTGTRVIVDLHKRSYSPCQNRRSIAFTDALPDVVAFLHNGLYLAVLWMYAAGEIPAMNTVLEHTLSTAKLSQLRLQSSPLYESRNFVGNDDTAFFECFCLDRTVAEFKLTWMRRSSTADARSAKPSTITSVATWPQGLEAQFAFLRDSRDVIAFVLQRWFQGKDFAPDVPENVLIVGTDTVDPTSCDPEFTNFGNTPTFACRNQLLQLFVDIFWSSLKDLVGARLSPRHPLTHASPTVLIGQCADARTKAYYNSAKHFILLNHKRFDADSIDKTLTELRARYQSGDSVVRLQTCVELRKALPFLFSPGQPPTALAHELFHALQGDSHSESEHGVQRWTIDGKSGRSFDDAAATVFQLVLGTGAISTFLAA